MIRSGPTNPHPPSAAPRLGRRQVLAAPILWGWMAHALASTARVAPPPEIAQLWPSARLFGQGHLRFMGLSVYDVRLWSNAPSLSAASWVERPLALELQYARSLSGRRIAERSLQEMQRGGALSDELAQRWLQAMGAWFPDVKAGDRITGIYGPEEGARFFHNARPTGHSSDKVFAQRFFGIWLSPWTSQPELRAALLPPSGST